MKHPFLIGDSVYLRALLPEDVNGDYVNWLNDSEVCKYNSHHVFPYTKQGATAYIETTANSRNALVLAIALKSNDKHIGNIALQNIDYVARSAEFAILLGDKESWGKGYSKEAAFLLFAHGFFEFNLRRIYCGTSAENVAMQKLAESLSMVFEGRRRGALFKHGRYVDIIEYGLLSEEFRVS